MQDKRKGQDLTDMAWGKMEAILDKEMPKKKDKKRYFIWMFFGALFITTVGAGLFLQNDKNETKLNASASSITKSTEEEKTSTALISPIKNEVKQEIKSSITEATTTEPSITKSSITKSSITESSITKSKEILQSHSANKLVKEDEIISKTFKERSVSLNEIPAQKLDVTKSAQNEMIKVRTPINTDQIKNINSQISNQIGQSSNAKALIKHLESALVIQNVPQEEIITTNKSDFNEVLSEVLKSETRNPEKEKQLNDQLDKIELLPLLPIPFIAKPAINVLRGIDLPEVIAPLSTKVVKAKSKLKLLPGIYAGAHFNPVFNFGGYEFGLTLTAPVSKRVSLSTGIGIADLNKKGFERIGIFDQNSDPASFEDLLNGNGAFAFELDKLSASELASSLKKLVYVQMPITLNYNLNKRIELSGGLNFAYLVNASAEGKVPSNLDPTGQARDYAVSTSELFEENVLNRWDTQLTAGFNMKFGKFLKLNVNYRYGLNHTLNALRGNRSNGATNDTGIKDFNRTIFVGLNYTFPTKKAK